jgi:hypothetical protein
VIYLHIPEANQFLMLDIYGKGEEKDNLTAAEKRGLKGLAGEYRKLIVEAARRTKQEPHP